MRGTDTRGTPYVRFNLLHLDSDQYRVWAAFRDQLIGSRNVTVEGGRSGRLKPVNDAADDHGTVVVWRLMSSNHREIATSGVGFASVPAAREHAAGAIAGAARLLARTVADPGSGVGSDRFSWALQNRATPAVIASRWHPSRRDVAVSLALTREALARADIVDAPIESRPVPARPRPRIPDGRSPDRRIPDVPVIEAGNRRPIKDIRRYTELGRGGR